MIYDMIWYGMTWHDMTWHDMTWYDMIWYDIWYDMIYDMTWHDMTWHDMTWHDMIWYDMMCYDMIWYDMLYLLTAIRLTPGGSSTVHIYTQTIHRTQLTILVGRLSGIRTQSGQNNRKECGPCPVFASYTLAFALQLRKKQGKTSVRVAEECQLARWKQQQQHLRIFLIPRLLQRDTIDTENFNFNLRSNTLYESYKVLWDLKSKVNSINFAQCIRASVQYMIMLIFYMYFSVKFKEHKHIYRQVTDALQTGISRQ